MAMDVNGADGVARRLVGNESDNEDDDDYDDEEDDDEVEMIDEEDVPLLLKLSENKAKRLAKQAADMLAQSEVLRKKARKLLVRHDREQAKTDELRAMVHPPPHLPAAVVAAAPPPPPPAAPAAPPQPPPPPQPAAAAVPAIALPVAVVPAPAVAVPAGQVAAVVPPPAAQGPGQVVAAAAVNFVSKEEWVARSKAAVTNAKQHVPTAEEIRQAKDAYKNNRGLFEKYGFQIGRPSDGSGVYHPSMTKYSETKWEFGVRTSKDNAITLMWLACRELESASMALGQGGNEKRSGGLVAKGRFGEETWRVVGLPSPEHVHRVKFKMRERYEQMNDAERAAADVPALCEEVKQEALVMTL